MEQKPARTSTPHYHAPNEHRPLGLLAAISYAHEQESADDDWQVAIAETVLVI